ncbi:MAG: type I restriction-modification system subunit S [Candidatus Desulfovibrio kirbyi]|uniref:Type I restriction-modification system subunit S n=1 Tax=Candidatus Desulfovibrio kirbyi TaxID=2696086 RepID=A0A6L2R743_9BACT|nr:MAG: type I restriction-modification system subunit S [Candidatus Desulfovibrio kirbyi]
MKDSGVEWIGEIPQEWERTKIKHIYRVIIGNGFPDTLQGNEFGELPFLKVSDINGDVRNIAKGNNYVSHLIARENRWNIIPPGSILMAKIGAALAKNHRKINTVDCIIDNNMQAAVKKDNTVHNAFGFHLWTLIDMTLYDNGGTVPSINNFRLLNQEIYIPSRDDQIRIADFLDAKCSKIESIIELQRISIEKLKSYKQTVISEAVTKGLNSDVPMKDSGVEWIGKIPVHWNIKRLKYCFKNLDSFRKPVNASQRTQVGDMLYDYYGASGAIDKIDDYIFDETSLLIAEDGANLLLRNLPLIYIATGKYWVNNHAHILKPLIENCLYFMANQMEIIDYTNYITGSAQPKLSQSNINNVPLVAPPLSEQKSIADFLDAKCAAIDNAIGKKESLIDKLTAYKKSLIYESVTGKIEV